MVKIAIFSHQEEISIPILILKLPSLESIKKKKAVAPLKLISAPAIIIDIKAIK
jgi:hypothetical protein